MTYCPARWIIATGLACIWMVQVVAIAAPRADEDTDQPAAAQAPILFPFHPAYRARPPRAPAPVPATVDELAAFASILKQPAAVEDDVPEPATTETEETEAAESPAAADSENDAASGAAEATDEPPLAAEPEEPPRELSPALLAVRDRVRSTLAFHRARQLSAATNSVTEIMAACLAFGCRTNVMRGDQAGKSINAITQLCWNYPCNRYLPLFLADGHIAARLSYGHQEHRSQLLATLALARVKADYPMRVGEDVRCVGDLVEGEKLRCRADEDLSLTLVGMAYYVTDDSTWKNYLGEPWSVEQIVREELAKPVVTAPDGGLNRLMGLSYTLQRRKKCGQPIDGQYRRAEKFLREFHDYAFQLQNSDGSWGPWFFSAHGTSRDPVQNLRGTGHILEWLALSVPEEDLEDPRMIRALEHVVSLLGSRRYRGGVRSLDTREIDSVMHALHALTIYDERLFQPADPIPAEEEAQGQEAEKVAGRPTA